MKTFKITPTVSGLSHPLMALAPDAAANREAWFDLPSLDGNNRVGKVKPGASLLAVRDLAEGPMPIIALQNVGKGQVLGLAIDTTWRWEMMRPAEGEDYFRKFWGNALRLLAPDPRVEPDRPQILRQQSSAAVGRTISLSTRLVDSVYQPVRGAEVRVKVTSPSGRVTHFLPRDGRDSPGLYQYDIALDEPGDWQVAVTNKDKTVTDKITAGTGLEELDDPRANLPAMTEFAKATGGAAVRRERRRGAVEFARSHAAPRHGNRDHRRLESPADDDRDDRARLPRHLAAQTEGPGMSAMHSKVEQTAVAKAVVATALSSETQRPAGACGPS